MNGTINITETLTPPIQFLPNGDSFEMQFAPLAGLITADVGWVRSPDIEDIEDSLNEEPELGGDVILPQNVKFQVRLFRPGSNQAVAQRTIEGNANLDILPNLTYHVPAEQAIGTWRCRFTNAGRLSVRFRPRVTFVKQILELKKTAIPIRLLNHGLSQLLKVLDLKIHLDKDRSYVDFSDELKEIANGRIRREDFSVPYLEDVNLSTLHVEVIAPLHTSGGEAQYGPPLIRIFVQFETRGEEVDTGFVDVDLESTVIIIHLELDGYFDRLGQPYGRILVTPTVRAGISGSLYDDFFNNVLSILIPGFRLGPDDIDEIRKEMEVTVHKFLMNAQFEIGDYLAKGLAQLAGYGHRFYDIAADVNNLLITHYDPGTHTPPNFHLIEAPITVMDSLAARQINAIGLENLDKIDNIVILMQENRSFDHMLGYLKKDKGRTDVEGLAGKEANTALGKSAVVVHQLSNTVFLDDPPHEHQPVLMQIADGSMSGFMASFIDRYPGKDFRQIMGYYTESQLPTFKFLAEQFLICDHWFCSHPGPTQPNRFCLVMGGRIPELENFMADSPALGFLKLPTFFDLLSENGVDWVYYEQDVAFLRFFDRYRLDDEHVLPFDHLREGFWTKAASGTLPKVTFIEPAFVNIAPLKEANDDHPPTDVKRGQDMIGCICNALISSPQWERTLFIVTYDEHGGFYDHVAPPGTKASKIQMSVPPIHANGPHYYGPRVPALAISPWVSPGAVDKSVYDHTSIVKTILLKFLRKNAPTLGEDYPTLESRRLVRAAHLGRLLTLKSPRQNVPLLTLNCPPTQRAVRPSAPRMTVPPPDDFHEAMRRFGRPKMHIP